MPFWTERLVRFIYGQSNKRVNIGEGGANIGFSKDGKTAFIALTGANAVAVIDVDKLTLISQIKAGKQPQGLIVW